MDVGGCRNLISNPASRSSVLRSSLIADVIFCDQAYRERFEVTYVHELANARNRTLLLTMPQKSPFTIDIPQTDILSYVFPRDTLPSEKSIWIDAEDTSNALSPKQLLSWVRRLGAGLDRLGIKQNEPVMMFSSNHIFVPVVYLGVAGSGRIFSGCNPAYGVNETAFQLENTGSRLVLVEPQFLETVLHAAEKNEFSKERIYQFSDKTCATRKGVRDWRSMLGSEQEAQAWRWRRMSPHESKTRIAVLNYSSGTTGLPKGVMISHQNIIANVEQSIFMRNLEQADRPAEPERWLGFLPLYHAYGQLWSITAAAITETPCFYMRSFSYADWLGHIQNHRITHLQTAPPILVMLAKRPETTRYDLSSLVNILCGAAPLSKELQNEVSEKCRLKIVQTWGMTEVTCSCLHVPGGVDDRSGAVGLIDPNSEIKLVDDSGSEVGPGERGEILVRGPNICLGYWRNDAATKDVFDDEGFMHTGDVAMNDDKGWFWIVDRKKELIKVKGFQVAPAELEAVLLENDHIADAAVVGLQGEHEELPRAYVVLKDAAKGKASEKDIQDWVAAQVAKHKRLDGGVKVSLVQIANPASSDEEYGEEGCAKDERETAQGQVVMEFKTGRHFLALISSHGVLELPKPAELSQDAHQSSTNLISQFELNVRREREETKLMDDKMNPGMHGTPRDNVLFRHHWRSQPEFLSRPLDEEIDFLAVG
nr:acyl-coa ligase azaf [Quercus suber]